MDNTVKDNPEKQNAKLLNIKPFPKLVCQSCLKVEPEELYFTDAQVISEKTKISSAVQMYNPNKVNKYGFSNIVRAGEPGIIYGFFMYGVKSSPGSKDFRAQGLVLLPCARAIKVSKSPAILRQLIFCCATFPQTKRDGCGSSNFLS